MKPAKRGGEVELTAIIFSNQENFLFRCGKVIRCD
jgi:hypothetical protein